MKTLAEILAWKFPDRIAGQNHIVTEHEDLSLTVELWNMPAPEPNPARVAQWRAEFTQVEADALLANLQSAYTIFSDGGKWAFGSAFDTVVNHIRRGDIAAALITVQMIAIPAEVPGVPAEELATWSAKKTEILALFP